MKWLINNWFHSTIFLAIYSLLFIFLFILPKDFALFLIWLHVPVYLLHETEEFVFPGGFPEIMTEMFIGKGKEVPFAIKRAGFWINIPFIVLGFPFVATLATLYGVSYGLYVVYFTLVATLPHFIQVIRTKKIYNPGLGVSVFLNLPVSIYTLYYLNSNGLISSKANIIGFIIAFLAMAGPMVFQLKKAISEIRNTETESNK